MQSQPDRLAFANALRGIAALVVLVSHYVVMFDQIHGEYGGFAALPKNAFPAQVVWLNELIKPIHLGALGVALFFLVSGLVLPISVRSYARAPMGRAAFVTARVLRLVPTYAVGLAISFATWWWATKHNGVPFERGTLSIYLANVSLFRDWIGVPQVDGVVWTLEVEAKFYLLILLFWGAVASQRVWPTLVVAALAVAAAPLNAQFPMSWNPPANFAWALPFLAYMGIGVGFSYHYMGRLSSRGLIALCVALLGAFVGIYWYNKAQVEVPASYAFALAAFAALYGWRRSWDGGPVVRFFARISYPLYAVHAPIGYIALRYLIGNGWNAMLAFGVVTTVVTAIAWATHVFIEARSQEIGKRMAQAIQRAAAGRLAGRERRSAA